jgi:hypothetical protein
MNGEPIARHQSKPLSHPWRKLAVSFAIAAVLMFFLGMISFDQYSGYLHPPAFPLSYVVTTPCFAILGACIRSSSYFLVPAAIDFALWYVAGSLGIFAIIALMTLNDSVRVSQGIKISKKNANFWGLAIVVLILFAIFIPVVPNIGGHFTECSGLASNQHCENVTQIESITYAMFCEGAIWDYPTFSYTLSICTYV